MASWLICRFAAALIGLAFALAPAAADDLADFNAAVERAANHNRVALGYLRTDGVDLAVIELERMQAAWGSLVQRCDGLASADTRKDPEFRRLIDGTIASLRFVPKAIETRDSELVHRLIGELRAFDNLLVFRFG